MPISIASCAGAESGAGAVSLGQQSQPEGRRAHPFPDPQPLQAPDHTMSMLSPACRRRMHGARSTASLRRRELLRYLVYQKMTWLASYLCSSARPAAKVPGAPVTNVPHRASSIPPKGSHRQSMGSNSWGTGKSWRVSSGSSISPPEAVGSDRPWCSTGVGALVSKQQIMTVCAVRQRCGFPQRCPLQRR